MNEDRFEPLFRQAAAEYNAPPETPRDAMWAAIRRERERRRAERRDPVVRPWHWGVGMAAMLAIGVGLGRVTIRAGVDSPDGRAAADPIASTRAGTTGAVASGAAPAGLAGEGAAALPYRLAATQHLSRTEALLTSYQYEVRAGRVPAEVAEWARELLGGTRLLLDSPAAEDPRLSLLLQDLELVLAQIAYLPAAGDVNEEAEWIDRALERRGTLSRLRAAVPAGAVVTTGT